MSKTIAPCVLLRWFLLPLVSQHRPTVLEAPSKRHHEAIEGVPLVDHIMATARHLQ